MSNHNTFAKHYFEIVLLQNFVLINYILPKIAHTKYKTKNVDASEICISILHNIYKNGKKSIHVIHIY